jgi:outer membrane beta-barrel protein
MRTARAVWIRRWQSLLAVAVVASLSASAYAKKDDEEVAEEPPAPVMGKGLPGRTLAERIPSVTHRAFTKTGRVELFPAIGLSLSDPFYRYVVPQIGLHYYFNETLALGASADYYGGIATTINVAGGSAIVAPSYNKPVFGARVELQWSPLYGKLSWLAESVMHFDTYLTGGVGIVSPNSGGMSLAGTIALGQHYFFNNWLALRAELREEMYSMSRDPSVSSDKTFQSLLSASLGVCFYFPQESDQED